MFHNRMIAVTVGLALFCAAIVWRLFDIQVIRGSEYSMESDKQAQQRVLITARRGDIRDCQGRVLSSSIGGNMRMSVSQMGGDGLKDSATESVLLKRVYPFGEAAGAVLGYVGKDGDGLGGTEFYFDKYLKGENGWTIMMRDGRNKKYPTMNLPKKEPVPGCDVYLTINVDIQKIAENVVRQTVQNLSAKGGMCIVMEPSTGKILAMVNEPSFNPNMANRYSLEQRSNKCVGYTYEPGSTFKALTASCALAEHVKKENDSLDGNHGVYEICDEKIRDEKPYGKISFTDAFAYSSNVCFAKIATAIGNERLYKYTRDFGLGDRTGIQLPGEECGVVHPVDKWSGRTLVTMAIGQEVSVTLLQMATVYAAIANDGVLCEPRIFDRVVSSGGAIIDSSEFRPIRRVVPASVAMQVKSMMAEVVKRGTGVKAAVQGIVIAGKTGTAQKIDKATGTYSNTRGWASFIGFSPPQNPQLLCAVLIDEPLRGEMGGTAAAPAFAKIMSQIISHPQLHYAERMLSGADSMHAIAAKTKEARLDKSVDALTDAQTDAQNVRSVPQLTGMPLSRAQSALSNEGIAFEVIGCGAVIDSQLPKAGETIHADAKLVLYTNANGVGANASASSMPDCRGKDLRDAINSVNLRGLVPCVFGTGFVQRQMPPVGALVQHAERCTLFCSFNIAKNGQ